MKTVTYFVAAAVVYDDQGGLVVGKAEQCPSQPAAVRAAERLAADRRHRGAIAFSRTGDPTFGEFEPAVILATFGAEPGDMDALLSDAA